MGKYVIIGDVRGNDVIDIVNTIGQAEKVALDWAHRTGRMIRIYELKRTVRPR